MTIQFTKFELTIVETISNEDDPWDVPKPRQRYVRDAIDRLRKKGAIVDTDGDPAEPDYRLTHAGFRSLLEVMG